MTRLLDDLSQITFVLDDMSHKGIDMYQNIWTLCHHFFSTWTICHQKNIVWTICHNYSLDDLSQLYLSHFLVIGRFVTNHICPRRHVTKRSDMYQNYMDDLSQFCLVLGQFVTLLFWKICHKSYMSQKKNSDLG